MYQYIYISFLVPVITLHSITNHNLNKGVHKLNKGVHKLNKQSQSCGLKLHEITKVITHAQH